MQQLEIFQALTGVGEIKKAKLEEKSKNGECFHSGFKGDRKRTQFLRSVPWLRALMLHTTTAPALPTSLPQFTLSQATVSSQGTEVRPQTHFILKHHHVKGQALSSLWWTRISTCAQGGKTPFPNSTAHLNPSAAALAPLPFDELSSQVPICEAQQDHRHSRIISTAPIPRLVALYHVGKV